jgi:superfamily II DNA helicase RecQ
MAEEVQEMFRLIQQNYQFSYNLKARPVEILTNVINQKHTFAMLPTGYGKSDCFILPPLLLDQPHQPHIVGH